jgi:hypothetical protein
LEIFYPQKDNVFWIVEVIELWDKVAWWVKLNNVFEEGTIGIVDGRRGLKTSFPNWKLRHLNGFQT